MSWNSLQRLMLGAAAALVLAGAALAGTPAGTVQAGSGLDANPSAARSAR